MTLLAWLVALGMLVLIVAGLAASIVGIVLTLQGQGDNSAARIDGRDDG